MRDTTVLVSTYMLHVTMTITIVKTIILEFKHTYCIVPGKHPCALTAQALKLRVANYMEEVLEYPHASAHPQSKVTHIVTLPVLSQKRPAQRWRKLIVLEKKQTCSLVAKFLQCLLLTVHEICGVHEERHR